MIWLRLKLDLLPCIAQEVEKVSSEYMDLAAQVRGGDKIAYRNLVLLQANVRTRIEEFEKFYDKFYGDYRIGYFEKLKLRLRKLLSPHIDVNKAIYQETQGIRRAELQQRRALSKEKDTSQQQQMQILQQQPQLLEEQHLNPQKQPQKGKQTSGAIAQQNNLIQLQNQAKNLFSKKAVGLQSPSSSNNLNSNQLNYDDSKSTISNKTQLLQSPSKNNDPISSKVSFQQQLLPQTTINNSNNNQPSNRQSLSQSVSLQQQQQLLLQQKNTSQKNQAASKSPISRQTTATIQEKPNNQIKQRPQTSTQPQKGAASQKQLEPTQNQQAAGNEGKSQVDEVVFTIRMTKEEYMKYLQAKQMKEK